MLTVYNAANNEDLLFSLISTIKNQPLKSIFAKEVFLIQNQGMERWLSQQLAQDFKVWAQYQFLLPPQFFKHISRQINKQLTHTNFDKGSMLWQIENLLRSVDDEIYAPLKQYLQNGNIEVKRYQLATQVARLFQNYQLLRPDLLTAWEQGELQTGNGAEGWQRALWLQLTQAVEAEHQADLWQSVINQLNHTTIGEFKNYLPERMIVFGVNSLPPVQLEYLQALSKHCEIHVFLQNPQATIHGLQHVSSHSLIATLGQQGREFQQLLLDKTQFKLESFLSKLPINKNNLQQLQEDILQASIEQKPLKNDGSISIHACHSRVREVEVLKNQLLQCLETQTELEVRDIVVIAPDIQAYAPFINSIFNDVPHSICGHNLRLSNRVLDSFIRFLELVDSRFEWQAVLDLLENPAVFPAFDLSEADLSLINTWLEETYVRWGKSAEHKQQLGLPPLDENTWQASLERLLMGYALASDNQFVDEVLPYHQLEGSSAQALGGLNDFMQLLFKASDELTQPKSFQDWHDALYQYAQLLFVDNHETQALYQVLADFEENLNTVNNQDIDLAVIIRWLENTLSEQKSANGLLRGKLTFSSMNAVRGIPFKVIAVLGMNEGEFPSVDCSPTFDLLSSNPQLGDPSRRTDDRQQFLELLFAAKEKLIISYIGQSQSQNATIPPSVVISELLEVLQQDYQLNDLLIKHPLQPFSRRYFENSNPALFSYSSKDAETAAALAQEKNPPQNWWQDSIESKNDEVIELEEVRKFYRHPQRYFMRRQLDVSFKALDSHAEAREPFAIDTLEAYMINHDWIACLLEEKEFDLYKLQAQGRYLSGVLGEVEFFKQQENIVNFVQKIQDLDLGEPLENLAVDIQIGESRLIGKLYNRYQNGSLFYRYSPLKGKDLMLALLHHCLVNQDKVQNTYLVSHNKQEEQHHNLIVLTAEHQSFDKLAKLLEIYFQGLERPDALFVDIALDYVKQADKIKTSTRVQKPALAVARDKLMLAMEQSYQMELQRLYGNSEDLTELLSEDFINFCDDFLEPLWASLQEEE